MKKLYRSSILLFLLSIVACTSASKSTTLQVIDFMEPEHFLEGAGFNLSKQKKGCLLEGVGYGETGQNHYQFYFNDTGMTNAYYTSYRYELPISEVNSNSDMFKVDEVAYNDDIDEDAKFLALFSELEKLITQDNLLRCRERNLNIE